MIAGVNRVEETRNDITSASAACRRTGVVELDASVMHGPFRAGPARSARFPQHRLSSRVAPPRDGQTDHVLLVGTGALEFAKAEGFKEENLLTSDRGDLALVAPTLSPKDDWIAPPSPSGPRR